MKLITAIVRPERLNDVALALTDAGARGMTVTEVRGFGQKFGHQAAVHSAGGVLILPKMRIDVVVQDQEAEHLVDVIGKKGLDLSRGQRAADQDR
jgi:nitrogen regulatory protein PII